MTRISDNAANTHRVRFGATAPPQGEGAGSVRRAVDGAVNGARRVGERVSGYFGDYFSSQAANPGQAKPLGSRFKSFFRGDVKGAFKRALKMAVGRPRGWAETALSLFAFGGVPVFFLKNLAEGMVGTNTWFKNTARTTITNFTKAHQNAFYVSSKDLKIDQNRTIWGAVKGLFTGREAFDQQVARVWREGGETGRNALQAAGVDLKKAGIEA